MSEERRNPAGIIIAMIGFAIGFGGLYLQNILLPGSLSDQLSAFRESPQLMDLSMALMIIIFFGVFLVAFGGMIQIMLDE
ncbi:hypothetical protein E4H12_09725 [Candidatus Thorarchaeota archaeon]|nr:MAG: hypothetical protein E4H12_09725 [Candidatus Thorarchaeota archaeon]